MTPLWTHVILHHSATRQTDRLQFPAIRRNHLRRKNPSGGTWQDIAYHRLVEVVDGTPLVVLGRDLYTQGSHCPGMNRSAIGWCFVGDFRGFEPPLDALLVAARHMAPELDLFSIPTENIGIHSDYRETECPGGAFPLKPFRELVAGYRKGGA